MYISLSGTSGLRQFLRCESSILSGSIKKIGCYEYEVSGVKLVCEQEVNKWLRVVCVAISK